MAFMIVGFGFALLPLLLRLALGLRLGIPLLYSVLMLTVFHGWYQAYSALADGILLAMIALAVLSWVVMLGSKLTGALHELLEDRGKGACGSCPVGQNNGQFCGQHRGHLRHSG